MVGCSFIASRAEIIPREFPPRRIEWAGSNFTKAAVAALRQHTTVDCCFRRRWLEHALLLNPASLCVLIKYYFSQSCRNFLLSLAPVPLHPLRFIDSNVVPYENIGNFNANERLPSHTKNLRWAKGDAIICTLLNEIASAFNIPSVASSNCLIYIFIRLHRENDGGMSILPERISHF